MVNKLPVVGRIQGASADIHENPQSSDITIQYTDRTEKWHEVTMPFLDAMYLLNLLSAIKKDSGFQIGE